MSKAKITDAITRLNREIDAIDADDPASRERLEALSERLRLRLELRESPPVDQDAKAILQAYEARYPQLTFLINDIMSRLAAMGI